MKFNRRTRRNSKDFNFSSIYNTSSRNSLYASNMLASKKFDKLEDLRSNLHLAFKTGNVEELRSISRYFFRISGIYARTVRYLAYMPTYSYYLLPHIHGLSINASNVKRELVNQLQFLDTINLETVLPSIAVDTIVDGVSYVYFRRKGKKAGIQKLPLEFCRVGSVVDGFPTVEFNLDYFNTFGTYEEKLRAAAVMPPEITYEWTILEENKIKSKREIKSAFGNWIALDPNKATAFYYNPSLQPLLANSFFSFIDVMQLKGVEKKKAENTMYNLIVQKFPLNDDSEPVFDISEIASLHQGAVSIFADNPSTDVLSTMADVSNIDLNKSSADPIDFEPWEKDIYSDLGVSSQLFSTEGNMALEKSIQVDESLILQLVKKFENWLDMIIKDQFNERTGDENFTFDFNIIPVTNLNRKDMIKTYQEMATFGYSKMLPALAAGQKQLQILSMAVFENDVLGLQEAMTPLQSSNQTSFNEKGNDGAVKGGKTGRPQKDISELSDKTIANIESGDSSARKV